MRALCIYVGKMTYKFLAYFCKMIYSIEFVYVYAIGRILYLLHITFYNVMLLYICIRCTKTLQKCFIRVCTCWGALQLFFSLRFLIKRHP